MDFENEEEQRREAVSKSMAMEAMDRWLFSVEDVTDHTRPDNYGEEIDGAEGGEGQSKELKRWEKVPNPGFVR
jgi:hypothetical protein